MSIIKAIITSGGSSVRFGKNKLLENINGKPVILHSVDKFTKLGLDIIVPVNKMYKNDFEKIFEKYNNLTLIEGGETRQESVYLALQAVKNADYVIVHDGARPNVQISKIKECIDLVKDKKAVLLATKTTDTIKSVDENNKIIKTIDRTNLINVQTPQAFEYNLLVNLHEKYKNQNFTDDAQLFEYANYDVFYINSDNTNIKITYPQDIKICEILCNEM